VARSHGTSFEDLKYAAAVKGFFLKQKGVVAFKEGKGGNDSIYELDIKAPAEDIRKTLDARGIAFRTLALHGDSVTVTIFDKGKSLSDNADQVADHYADQLTDFREIHGTGDVFGGDTRKDALDEYRRIIDSQERSLPASRRYRDARGRGFADYWGRADAQGPVA